MAQRPFTGTFARNPKPAGPQADGDRPAVEPAIPAESSPPKGAVSADINAALETLGKSIQNLREAVDYRLKLDENQGELRSEFNRMNDERKRLAARLDQAEGRGQVLQQVNRDVSKRLAVAMETIRTVLENQAK
jgi:hypothetical protein